MYGVKICLIGALLTAVTVPAFGQQRPAATRPGGQYNDAAGIENPGQPGREPMSEQKREEVRKKIEAVRIWRLTEALKLDVNTSAKLSSLLSSVDNRRREIIREKTGTISALRFIVRAPKPDQAKIKDSLEKLDKNRLALQELTNNETNGLKNILTIEQQARYVVFQHEFMREMRGMIGGAHGNPGKLSP